MKKASKSAALRNKVAPLQLEAFRVTLWVPDMPIVEAEKLLEKLDRTWFRRRVEDAIGTLLVRMRAPLVVVEVEGSANDLAE